MKIILFLAVSIFNFHFPISPVPSWKGRKKDPVSLSPASEAMSRRAEHSFLQTFFKMPKVCKKTL